MYFERVIKNFLLLLIEKQNVFFQQENNLNIPKRSFWGLDSLHPHSWAKCAQIWRSCFFVVCGPKSGSSIPHPRSCHLLVTLVPISFLRSQPSSILMVPTPITTFVIASLITNCFFNPYSKLYYMERVLHQFFCLFRSVILCVYIFYFALIWAPPHFPIPPEKTTVKMPSLKFPKNKSMIRYNL